MDKRIRQGVFVLFMALLVLPAVQFKFNLVKMRPLGGTYVYEERPSFTKKEWLKGEYQEKYARYINDHIGFREFFLRSFNQFCFSVFSIPRAQQIIVGKNSTLFELNYIRDYTGTSFRGKEVINEQVAKLRFLQDTMNQQGVKLIVYFAPGKASFFPECIPQRYLDSMQAMSNYRYYAQTCREAGLRCFDMNAWFVSQKNKSPYPLYHRGGIHWSSYGWTLALDSLCRFMGQQQGTPLPQMEITEVQLSDTARDTDNDIEKALNLLCGLPHDQYAYPLIKINEGENVRKPSVLIVADSYWWNVFSSGNTLHVFDGCDFWYYNTEVYYDDGRPMVAADQLNILSEVQKKDFVIILSTEANLFNFGWGFIEKLYDQYHQGWSALASEFSEEEIRGQVEYIRNDPEWMSLIEEKAKANLVPVDTQIRNDALYILSQRRKE